MGRSNIEVVEGKAAYDRRSLAAWVPDVVERIFKRTEARRVDVFGSVDRATTARTTSTR
jgi:hypothetical protein